MRSAGGRPGRGPPAMIRFLHIADLHLGMRITRFDEGACGRIGEARFEAVEQLRRQAAAHKVDFILVAGDLFDDHSVSRTVAERAFTLFEGKTIQCPVYVIPGNHDPLTPGGVWDRDPWHRAQPAKHWRLLREPAPVDVPGLPVTIFPCPLRNRNSTDDPTAWIARHPRPEGDRAIRIGLAHGSLRVMPDLPHDDHLIRPDAADHYQLDYLALGHWHKPLRFATRGVERTAYSGTHEPMRFPDSAAAPATGWSSYSDDGDAERFRDEGKGAALLVTIDGPGAPPAIERLDVGRLHWLHERRDVTSRPIGELIRDFAGRENRELTLLSLKVCGVLDPQQYLRLEEIRDIVCNRYFPGSSVDVDEVLVEPAPDQLGRLVGDGVLSRVVERLRGEAQAADPRARLVAEHALKRLYRIVWEEQPS